MFNFSKASFKEKIDFMKKIDYLTNIDFTKNIYTLESISKIHPSLTETNPMLYILYLERNKDIDNEERVYYLKIIEKLSNKEKELFENIIKNMKDSSEN